jgi:GDPmannose 4,6-dehydratase
VDFLLADTGRARRELGWEPKIKFEELVRIMVDADLEEIGVTHKGDGSRILRQKFGDWHQWSDSVSEVLASASGIARVE